MCLEWPSTGFPTSPAWGGEQGFLEDYSGVVWAIVAGQAANGLLMSVLFVRLFVIFWSMLVNTLLSWVLLGLRFTPFFLFYVYDQPGSLAVLQVAGLCLNIPVLWTVDLC